MPIAYAHSRFRSTSTLLLATLLLSACGLRPLPQDVGMRYDSAMIVDRVRCEAKWAIYDNAIAYLKSLNQDNDPSNDIPQTVISKYEGGVEKVQNFDINTIPVGARTKFARYQATAIVYDFIFDISNNNDSFGSSSLSYPFYSGVFGAKISQTTKLGRRNKRSFRLEESFIDVVKNQSVCMGSKRRSSKPNNQAYAYPIQGDLDLSENIQTFWKLNETGILFGFDDVLTSQNDEKSRYPVLVDEIVFTTELLSVAGVNYTKNIALYELRLTPVELSNTNTRKDIHQLTIAFAMPPEAPKENTPKVRRVGSSTSIPQSVKDNAKSAASNAIDQRRFLSILPLDYRFPR